ncbi:LytTR family DNA-binding domain-containing protein [Azospirillum sp.]|uniref:LytTR family DNA-binding domain-containing protein n=1 Tax=Azospirillum sp. TaxID=34012 RepID=UPI00260CAEBD|nr:LytTR family DNA-binding domain-containing protein [Azospirillum sp.]
MIPSGLRGLLARRLPVLGVSVAALTVLGPFGTFQDMSLSQRLAYWGGLLLVGTLEFDLVILITRRVVSDQTRRWPWMLAAAIMIVSLIQTAIVAVLEQQRRGMDAGSAPALTELYGYVLVITLLVAAAPIWLELRRHGLIDASPTAPSTVAPPAVAPESAPASGPDAAPFLDRIPPRLGRDLLALEMEDHYVRVHTQLGSDLILLRLRDAIAELSGIDGLQVHRSHWVAASAVATAERNADGKLTLILTDGRRVPVSRSYNAAVRAAGWAERDGGASHTQG